MNVAEIPPMKPVLVTEVTDNVNVLQKGDVKKQATVLSARAIADLFKCAPIKKTNETDVGYFTEDDKVDLDKITESCSRTLTKDQYIHGPVVTWDKVVPEGADSKWFIHHQPEAITPHGFLYVFSVLDDSELQWANYDGKESIPDWDDTDRKVLPRAKSPKIRQVFVPNTLNQLFPPFLNDAGEIAIDRRSRYDAGVAWTRYGSLKEDGSGYEWEPWYLEGKTHDGAKYFVNVNINSTTITEINNPLFDAIYHVFSEVKLTLPNANLDGLKPGMKIVVEVHPPREEGVTSACNVLYTDTKADGSFFKPGTEDDQDRMHLLVTPRTQVNTKDIFGRVAESALVTSVATFELVEMPDPSDPSKIFRTWELDSGVEETDFTAGLAQMLAEHTDPRSRDLVQFQREAIVDLKTLSTFYAVSSGGYAIFRVFKHDNAIEKLSDSELKIFVKKIHLGSEACFNKADVTADPDPSQIYYVREGGRFSITENDGHPSHFNPSKEYYTIDLTHCEETDIIQIPDGADIRNYLTLNDLEWDVLRGFNDYINRNDLIHVVIETNSTKTFSEFQDKLFPVLYFTPSPHDDYIHKGSINPSAFTYDQLMKLFKNGTVLGDVDLDVNGEVISSMLNTPASSRALIEAYLYLASNLQKKGLLHGNYEHLDLNNLGCDTIVTPGFHYIKPRMPILDPNTFPPNMTENGCNIVVITNDHANGNKIHESSTGGYTKADRLTQIAFVLDTSLMMYFRFGQYDEELGKWNFGPWSPLEVNTNWEQIRNKPLFFRSRWDYFEDPNTLLNHVDSENVEVVHSGTTNRCEIVHKITADEIAAIMLPSDNPAYDETVKFKKPQFAVGVDILTPAPWFVYKNPSEDGFDYVVDIELPDATPTEIANPNPSQRRSIRFLFLNNPATEGWTQIQFRLHYRSSVDGQAEWVYNRIWHGKYKSYITLDFEQVDLPTGDRAWCPVVVG